MNSTLWTRLISLVIRTAALPTFARVPTGVVSVTRGQLARANFFRMRERIRVEIISR